MARSDRVRKALDCDVAEHKRTIELAEKKIAEKEHQLNGIYFSFADLLTCLKLLVIVECDAELRKALENSKQVIVDGKNDLNRQEIELRHLTATHQDEVRLQRIKDSGI
jgi:hypothetical protein